MVVQSQLEFKLSTHVFESRSNESAYVVLLLVVHPVLGIQVAHLLETLQVVQSQGIHQAALVLRFQRPVRPILQAILVPLAD